MQNEERNFTVSDIKISNRNCIEITGVQEVISYDENSIILVICGDKAIVEGEDLRVTELCVQEGKVCARGKFISIVYEDMRTADKGFFSKLIRG